MNLTTYFNQGISRNEYLNQIKIQLNDLETNGDENNLAKYYTINFKRIDRIDNKFELSTEQKELLKQVNSNFRVLIITEGWCGDAAQVEPVIAKILKKLNIESKYIFRDQNMDLMDSYLTNGTKSIPIFIGINSEGNEIFRYGPRPEPGMDFLQKHKENPEIYTKDKFHTDLHLWYSKDKGKTIFEEFLNLIK